MSDRQSAGSVTYWLGELHKDRPTEAQRGIWIRYFQQLVEFARRKLGDSSRTVRDEEDAVLSAMDSFFRRCQQGKFADLSRESLWPLLVTITAYKAADHRRWSLAQRRGGKLRVDGPIGPGGLELHQLLDEQAMPPDFPVQVAEATQRLLDMLPREELKETALLKLEGFTNQEIAERHRVIERTIERRVAIIRSFWSSDLDKVSGESIE